MPVKNPFALQVKKLQEQVQGLIKGCKMQGPSHDELHKFLMEFIPAVDGMLSTAEANMVTQVAYLLEIYPKYFE